MFSLPIVRQRLSKHDQANEDCCCIDCIVAAPPHYAEPVKDSPYLMVITTYSDRVEYKFVAKDRKQRS